MKQSHVKKRICVQSNIFIFYMNKLTGPHERRCSKALFKLIFLPSQKSCQQYLLSVITCSNSQYRTIQSLKQSIIMSRYSSYYYLLKQSILIISGVLHSVILRLGMRQASFLQYTMPQIPPG